MPYHFPKHKVVAARIIEWLAHLMTYRAAAGLGAPGELRSAQSVLLVEPFQMGDVISLSSILQPLKDLLPKARIVVLTQLGNADFLRGDPRVDEILTCNFPWVRAGDRSRAGWRACRDTLRKLKEMGGFDVGIDTRGDFRSHWTMLSAGCRRRIGYSNYAGSNMRVRGLLLTDNIGNLPVMNRFLINREVVARAFKIALPEPAFPLLQTPHIPKTILVQGKQQVVVVHPGAGAPHRRWEKEKWAEVLRHLATQPDLHTVLVGGPGDQAFVEAISRLRPEGQTSRITSYGELQGLLKGSTLFVGMDSGPMNLAVSMGVPVLALFGPSDHQVWYPLGAYSRSITKFRESSSDPSLQGEPGAPPHPSLQQLTAAEVIALLDELLSEIPRTY